MKVLNQLYFILFVGLAISACGGSSSSLSVGPNDGNGGTGTVCDNARVSWIAPTLNTDGTPLDNLAGFKVYRGLNSQDYSQVVQINNPATSDYQFQNLSTGLVHYFSATAFNSLNVSSAYASEVSKMVTDCSAKDEDSAPVKTRFVLQQDIDFLQLFAQADLASRYDLLRDSYNAAKGVPAYTDFHEIGDPSSRYCVEVLENAVSDLQPIMMHKFTKTLDGGGPLLPPETIERVIVHARPNLMQHFDITANEFTRKDLISILSLDPNSQVETRIRKSGELLHFYRKNKTSGGTVRSFGYCY
jgi:hypothetical protein